MTTLSQKILNALTKSTISLEWGSHRREFGLGEHIVLEEECGESEELEVKDPITNRAQRFHVRPPVVYKLKNISFHPLMGTLRVRGFPLRESFPYYYQGPFIQNSPGVFMATVDAPATTAFNIQTNYYHFLLEDLPRLILLKKNYGCEKIFTGNYPLPTFVYEYLEALAIEVVKISSPRIFRHLWFTAAIGNSGVPTQFASKLVRGAFPSGIVQSPPRVYVSRRRSQRNFFDEELLVGILESRGFTEVFMEELPSAQQISIAANAEVLVGPHGAGLTNLLFLADGSRVVEIANPENSNPVFETLASKRLHYSQVLVESDRTDRDLRLQKALLEELDF